MSEYSKISCDFYDQFEIHAMRQNWVELRFKGEIEGSKSKISKIKNLVTKDKEEFAILLDDGSIRLDQFESITAIGKNDGILGHLLDKVDYNHSANRKVINVLDNSNISGKIISQVSHIINALHIWNSRLLDVERTFEVWQDHDPSLWDYLINECYNQTVASFNTHEVADMISYTDTKGNPFRLSFSDIIYHQINHSTYHRGQIILLLQQSGRQTTSTDYLRFVLNM